jgi:hypothetical protein
MIRLFHSCLTILGKRVTFVHCWQQRLHRNSRITDTRRSRGWIVTWKSRRWYIWKVSSLKTAIWKVQIWNLEADGSKAELAACMRLRSAFLATTVLLSPSTSSSFLSRVNFTPTMASAQGPAQGSCGLTASEGGACSLPSKKHKETTKPVTNIGEYTHQG